MASTYLLTADGSFCRFVRRVVLTALLCASCGSGAIAHAPLDSTGGRPLVGIALSGGGAKGFAHIGVLRALEKMGLPIDRIAGTSMGSVIGGLYATGHDTEALERMALEQDWDSLFDDAPVHRFRSVEQRVRSKAYLISLPLQDRSIQLPRGLIAGQEIAMLLSRLTLPVQGIEDFSRLSIPFVAVATDLATGEGVRLHAGSLPRAIRASMAIPGLFVPVEIDGRTYIDGGIARNIPAEDARSMGADIVVCSDVSDPLFPPDSLESFVDVLMQATSYQMARSDSIQRQLCDVIVRPDIQGASMMSFELTAEMIRKGEEAVDGVRRKLEALIDTVGHVTYPRRTPDPPSRDSVYVSELAVEGQLPLSRSHVRDLIGLQIPGYVTIDDLDEAIYDAYATGLFHLVTYRLDSLAQQTGPVLVIHAHGKEEDRVGVGLRYDSHYKAAILLGARRWGVAGYRSELEMDVRAGEILQAQATYTSPLTDSFRFQALLRGGRYPIDLFEGGEAVSSLTVALYEAEARLGVILFEPMAVAGAFRFEVYDPRERIGPMSPEEPRGLLATSALLYLDTYDRLVFPTRGHRLHWKCDLATEVSDLSAAFARVLFRWASRVPVGDALSALGGVDLGYSYGDMVPIPYRFLLGGETGYQAVEDWQFPLVGFDVHELGGRNMQAVRLGLQFRFTDVLVLLLRWNAARTMQEWNVLPGNGRLASGIALTAGAATRFGPVELTLAGREWGRDYWARISAGYAF